MLIIIILFNTQQALKHSSIFILLARQMQHRRNIFLSTVWSPQFWVSGYRTEIWQIQAVLIRSLSSCSLKCQDLAKKRNTQPQYLPISWSYLCGSKMDLNHGILSQLSPSSMAMMTNADQWKWHWIHNISTVLADTGLSSVSAWGTMLIHTRVSAVLPWRII